MLRSPQCLNQSRNWQATVVMLRTGAPTGAALKWRFLGTANKATGG